jgi:hypothetical protein
MPCRDSIPVIAQPIGQVFLAPAPILFHGVERAEISIVQNGFIIMHEGVADMLFKGSLCRRLKIFPILGIGFGIRHGGSSMEIIN